MAIAESMLPEFDRETATTRVLLARVPEDKAEWQPHLQAMPLGQLAMHIANIPQWAAITLERTEFDADPPGGSSLANPPFQSTGSLLQYHDANVSAARVLLARTTDAEFMVPWTLKNGGKRMYSMPRVAVFRSFVLNHAVHHRGQLTIYLRLLDVPVPNLYGLTADEQA